MAAEHEPSALSNQSEPETTYPKGITLRELQKRVVQYMSSTPTKATHFKELKIPTKWNVNKELLFQNWTRTGPEWRQNSWPSKSQGQLRCKARGNRVCLLTAWRGWSGVPLWNKGRVRSCLWRLVSTRDKQGNLWRNLLLLFKGDISKGWKNVSGQTLSPAFLKKTLTMPLASD